ncbi:PaaI family thioesterase [Blastomonas sp.]|uniref:PaaI family thioesterase n=1 Tax=Blastomonas sp. TaxID=1909299 RepID=UPI002608830F|nr:PaaI family thioesterase [Blastomonas sp.]MDM7955410.1 PaaI family thioesterase [Blastomonas sp.]
MDLSYSNAAIERALRNSAASSGFNRWSGMRLLAAGGGQVCLEIDVREDLTQHHGFVHGGIVGALADTACSWAAATLAGDVVTASYTIQFHAPATSALLRARANVIKQGRRNVSVEGQVYSVDSGGFERRVATALALIAVVPAPASTSAATRVASRTTHA